ncbi:hypothetical protein B0H19DRAFT_1249013 [Mycena capillaripes]|nr:hypothetical protein B0H19DRAFT_1249013 [Mycena capillaripes]
MSDRADSSFAQPTPNPNIFRDGNGTVWHCDLNGQWIPVPVSAPSQDMAPGATAQQGPLQPSAFSFPSPAPVLAFPSHLIDPHLAAPPQIDGLALHSPFEIAQANLRPASKVGGVRQVDKGKKHQLPSDSDDSEDGRATKRGRLQGSANYNKEDTKKCLKFTKEVLPVSAKGWRVVERLFGSWAVEKGQPKCDAKSLETKYKQLLRKKKPTGDGYCPPAVQQVHEIEHLINSKADTHALSDESEFDDDNTRESSDIVEVVPSTKVRTAIARHAPTPPLHSSGAVARRPHLNAPELVSQLSKAFDPAVATAREAKRAEQSLQATHMFGIDQQLRDALAANENLCNQITVMQDCLHDVQRAQERAEMQLELFQTGMGPHGRVSCSRAAVYKANPDLIRVDGKVRFERVFAGGGGCTQWFSDPSDDEDVDKENLNPSSSSRRSSVHDEEFLYGRRGAFTFDNNDSPVASTSASAGEAGSALSSSSKVDGSSKV